MKLSKRIFLLLLYSFGSFLFFILLSTPVKSYMPPIYPTYGYNQTDHLCQIKQLNAESVVNEKVIGEYQLLQECRIENPQIIFYTGSGILIWFGLIGLMALLNFVIYPKLKKLTNPQKQLNLITEIVFLGLALFFIVLLQHYFSVPRAYYNYQSDIDHIIYMTFVRGQIPFFFAVLYLIISSIKISFLHIKTKH